jgi:hypothetical protein
MQQLDRELFPVEEIFAAELNPAVGRSTYDLNISILNRKHRLAKLTEKIEKQTE